MKLLVILAVLGLLAAPALSVHTVKGCACMSDCCNGSHQMSCCSKYFDVNNSCSCQISSLLSIGANDPGYSCIGKGSSRPYGRDGPSMISSCSGDAVSYSGPSLPDGTGPPDLDMMAYLPPSAKLVFDVLASVGPMTQKDLISKTDLPARTVRYAIGRLKDESVIRECFYFPDARQSLYKLNTA